MTGAYGVDSGRLRKESKLCSTRLTKVAICEVATRHIRITVILYAAHRHVRIFANGDLRQWRRTTLLV